MLLASQFPIFSLPLINSPFPPVSPFLIPQCRHSTAHFPALIGVIDTPASGHYEVMWPANHTSISRLVSWGKKNSITSPCWPPPPCNTALPSISSRQFNVWMRSKSHVSTSLRCAVTIATGPIKFRPAVRHIENICPWRDVNFKMADSGGVQQTTWALSRREQISTLARD